MRTKGRYSISMSNQGYIPHCTITSRIIFLTDEEVLTLIHLSKETRRNDVIDDIGNRIKSMLKGI